jgi:hypothetical protein
LERRIRRRLNIAPAGAGDKGDYGAETWMHAPPSLPADIVIECCHCRLQTRVRAGAAEFARARLLFRPYADQEGLRRHDFVGALELP